MQGNHIKQIKVITTPFVNDFNLVSNNKGLQQKLIKDVVKKAETMGLHFKPSKFWSLSILGGSPKDVSFAKRTNGGKLRSTY